MKLLLHVCCAPCAIYPAAEAKREKRSVTGFFCNSNIHPNPEYIKRKKEAEKYFRSEKLEIVFGEYDAGNFFKSAGNRTPPARCEKCWDMRLSEAASFAKKNGFTAFTTTLLGSPYQDHEALKKICERLSKEKSVDFYYTDYRKGFKDAHDIAREKGIYCQNYCGCVFSMVEKEVARRKKRSQ